MVGLWRGWLGGRLGHGRLGRGRAPVEADIDPFAGSENAPPIDPDALSALLGRIEADALAVYAERGLPTRPGHYRRGPRAARWTFLAERMSPEDRWALALERPTERGWRYGTLQDLGAHESRPDLKQAARLLAAVADLRVKRRDSGLIQADDLADAIRLGAEWRVLHDARTLAGGSRLALTAPKSKSRSRKTKR